MTERPLGSEYLLWAKTHPAARFDLTLSGVPHASLADLAVSLDDLSIGPSGMYGYPPLVEAIAARYRVPTESVVLAQGTSMANHLAMAALLAPGDEVLIEQPTYEPILAVARFLGAAVRRFERSARHGFQVDADEVARQFTPQTRLVVLTNLHNPSSARTDDETLREIGAAAQRVGARVLVDEVYLDALFESPPRTAFHLGPAFVVTSSLTKIYGLSGLRCGWILAVPDVARQMWRLTELYSNIGVHVGEQLGRAAFERLDVLSARSRALLDANAATLNRFLQSHPDLEAPPHTAGTVSFPRVRQGRVDELCRLLHEQFDTLVVPGHFFERPDHIRIGLGTAPEPFAEGLRRLGQALDLLGHV